jgi:hypothetical protein
MMDDARQAVGEALGHTYTAAYNLTKFEPATEDMINRFFRLLEVDGYRVVLDDPNHYVCVTEDTWFIQHSLDCRIAGTIGTCKYSHVIKDLSEASHDFIRDHSGVGFALRITGIDRDGNPTLEGVT